MTRVPASPTESHTTFGGAPCKKLNWRKSLSFETRMKSPRAAWSPDLVIGLPAQSQVLHVSRAGIRAGQDLDQPRTQVLVEEQLHAAGELPRRRSRAAANESAARMSSRLSEGKSARIWSSLIPPA